MRRRMAPPRREVGDPVERGRQVGGGHPEAQRGTGDGAGGGADHDGRLARVPARLTLQGGQDPGLVGLADDATGAEDEADRGSIPVPESTADDLHHRSFYPPAVEGAHDPAPGDGSVQENGHCTTGFRRRAPARQPPLRSGHHGHDLRNLHVIAAHVLGRRRFAVSGHFGLRASPWGVATPAFGPEPEVLRLAGPHLVREVGNEAQAMPIDGATLAELAAFARTDLASDYSAGAAMPAPGAPTNRSISTAGSSTPSTAGSISAGERSTPSRPTRHLASAGRRRSCGPNTSTSARRSTSARAGVSTSASRPATPSRRSPTRTWARGDPSGRVRLLFGTHRSAPCCGERP